MGFYILFSAIVIVFLIYTSRRPDEFTVERSRTIHAAPAEIFALVNDFRQWALWSPWVKLDLAAKHRFEGAAAGAGAIFKWDGNKQVGSGILTITESVANEHISIRMELIKPLAGIGNITFTFTPSEDKTLVNWRITGKNNFFAKFINMFVNCETMTGNLYEEGLANIAKSVEKN